MIFFFFFVRSCSEDRESPPVGERLEGPGWGLRELAHWGHRDGLRETQDRP